MYHSSYHSIEIEAISILAILINQVSHHSTTLSNHSTSLSLPIVSLSHGLNIIYLYT